MMLMLNCQLPPKKPMQSTSMSCSQSLPTTWPPTKKQRARGAEATNNKCKPTLYNVKLCKHNKKRMQSKLNSSKRQPRDLILKRRERRRNELAECNARRRRTVTAICRAIKNTYFQAYISSQNPRKYEKINLKIDNRMYFVFCRVILI